MQQIKDQINGASLFLPARRDNPHITGILERTWDMIKDSKLPMKWGSLSLLHKDISMENGVVHYGGEFYSDDDLKSWALVSSFAVLISSFPPHQQANIEVHCR